MNTAPLVIEKTIQAPAAKIWEALTDREQMKQWYFEVDGFEPRLGFEFSFTGEDKGVKFVHYCKITELVPGKKLSYSWRYKDYPGSSMVTFELFDEGDSTRVKLTHAGLETFPKDNSSFGRESFTAGWEYILGKSLKEYVEK